MFQNNISNYLRHVHVQLIYMWLFRVLRVKHLTLQWIALTVLICQNDRQTSDLIQSMTENIWFMQLLAGGLDKLHTQWRA